MHVSDIEGETIELKDHSLNPCINCLKCLSSKRCAIDDAFNRIYASVIACDVLFIVSPHYAPIPAKLCMLLEKMEQITFLPWEKDNSYRSEICGIATAVISHGGSGDEKAQKEYRRVVNDPIANALRTIQLQLVPFDDEWSTGICVRPIHENAAGEPSLDEKIGQYVRKVLHVEEANGIGPGGAPANGAGHHPSGHIL